MTIPPYVPQGPGVIFPATSGAASFTTSGVSVEGYRWLSFVFVWTGFNTADATITLEISNDNSNWDPKTGAVFTLSAAADTQGISLNGVVTELFYRVVFAHGSNTAGTISCVMAGKN